MKQCPSCSSKNPDSAKFCQSCGASLEGVESTQADFSSTASELLTQAGNMLGNNVKKAKEAVAAGIEKSKEAAAARKERVQNTVQAGGWESPTPSADNSQPNGGWDDVVISQEASSVNVKKYSFFQGEEEETIAVIGETAVASDLEGTYRGPYAVLTEERLYCKNEDGNFIIPASSILSVKETRKKTGEWVFWLAVVLGLFFGMSGPGVLLDPYRGSLFIGICFVASGIATGFAIYFHWRDDLKKTSIALILVGVLLVMYILPPIVVVVYLCFAWKNHSRPTTFSIHCVGRSFPFIVENYPQQELQDFQNQVALLTGVPLNPNKKIKSGNGAANMRNSSYQAYRPPKQPAGRNSSPIVTLAAVVVILAIVIFAGVSIFKAVTTCKVDGCENEVYKDGYCTMHYAGNRANQAAGDFFDSLFG